MIKVISLMIKNNKSDIIYDKNDMTDMTDIELIQLMIK